MNRSALTATSKSLWSAAAFAASLCFLPSLHAALTLHPESSSPFDLKVSGLLKTVPTGAVSYVRWSELRALPIEKFTLTGEFGPGQQEVTVVWLKDLWAALPLGEGADTLLADCSDGYASVYTGSFIARFKPFVVLEIDGRGPEQWPPEGLKFNPGPYVISVSKTIVPEVAGILDVGHKRPWGVIAIEVVRYEDRFKVFSEGKWATLSVRAQEGRQIWVDSCFSCHQAPGGGLGGRKSDRPFEVLAAHAAYNRAYFMRFVRDPQGTMPGAKMEAHPHYTDVQLDALMAFITAETKVAAAR